MFYTCMYVILTLCLECFPVSSSGHALLFKLYVDRYVTGPLLSIPSYIDYLVHGPIVLVLICFFYKRWICLLRRIRITYPIVIRLIARIFIVDSITVSAYYLFSYTGKPIWFLPFGFFITTFCLMSVRYAPYRHRIWGYGHSVVLGFAQGCALLPGISRFAITFVTARWLGFSDKQAFESCFLVEIPISCAAFAKGLYRFAFEYHATIITMNELIAIGLSAVATFWGFYVMHAIIVHKKIWVFSCYTAIIGIITAWLFL